jgi:hypothetical protein
LSVCLFLFISQIIMSITLIRFGIWLSLFSITHTFLLSYVQYPLVGGSTPTPNIAPTGLIMQHVRAAWGVIGAADAYVRMGYSQMFSLRFQVNCLTVTNFVLQFPASVPLCEAEPRCVLVSISALCYRIYQVWDLALVGAIVASCSWFPVVPPLSSLK